MRLKVLCVMSLTMSLGACQSYAAKTSCPQPPPVLLQREPSLAEINPLKMPLSEKDALRLWALDAAQYELLRSRHADLQGWIRYWCLSGKK